MPQRMIHQYQRQHGFSYRRGADADAGVVAALGHDLGGGSMQIDGLARRKDGAGRLDRDRHLQVLPGADATQRAAGIVAGKACGGQRVAMRGAALRHAGKTGSDFHTRLNGSHDLEHRAA